MLASSGEITEPWPVRVSSTVTIPSSKMPARNRFLDEPGDALVADPVLQEADDPFLRDLREERPDISVEDEVHLSAADPDDQGIQRVVLTAPWSEPTREPEEVLLVDRVQYRGHRLLDDLVFERSDRKRALAAVFLRNVA